MTTNAKLIEFLLSGEAESFLSDDRFCSLREYHELQDNDVVLLLVRFDIAIFLEVSSRYSVKVYDPLFKISSFPPWLSSLSKYKISRKLKKFDNLVTIDGQS